MVYPMSVGRNFDDILRVIDALQLGDANQIATPANCQPGNKVIIPPFGQQRGSIDAVSQGLGRTAPLLAPDGCQLNKLTDDPATGVREADSGFRLGQG